MNNSLFSQFINNNKGELITDFSFFNPSALKTNRIKTIKLSYSEKKPLLPIQKIPEKTSHYNIDTLGRITRFYHTRRLFNGEIDTAVEWRYYKNNHLRTVKKTEFNRIKVKSFFYEENKPSVVIYGKSVNNSRSKINLNVSKYKEESAEYINYTPLKNGDTLIKKESTNGIVFQKKLIHYMNNTTRKESFSFPFVPKKDNSITYEYEKGFLVKLSIENPAVINHYYTFTYNSKKNPISYIKYNSQWNTPEEFSELIYDEDNGNLKAVVTKNYRTNNIKIKKINYSYY